MSKSSLELKSFKDGVARYTGKHSTSSREGTTLEFDVVCRSQGNGRWEATIEFEGCIEEGICSTIHRLGEWLQRAADALADSDWTGDSIPWRKGAKL